MKHLLLFFCIILQTNFVFSIPVDTLKIRGANDIQIVPYLKEYVDCSGEEQAETILDKWLQTEFQQVPPARVVNRGVTQCIHWFALTLYNASDYRENYLWNFYNDGIKFTLYELNDNQSAILREESLSHYTPISERPILLRSVSFLLPMESGETKTFLLKTEIHGRQNLYFPTDLSTKSDILSHELGFSFLLGRYYGFFWFAIVFNLCLFVVLRKRFFAMMLGYVSSLMAFNMVEFLHDVYIVPGILYTWWAEIPKLVFLALALYFNVYVFMSFVQQDKYFPALSKIMAWLNKGVLLAGALYLALHLIFDKQPLLLHLIQVGFVAILLVQTAFLLFNIAVALYKKTPYILHYMIGNALLFLSVILYLLNAFDILYLPQIFEPGNIIFAFSVECIYLMIVFTVKYKSDFDRFMDEIVQGKEKRDKLTAALLSAQENERNRVAQDVHDGIGGTLHGLRLLLGTEDLKGKEKINKMLLGINDDFRRLIHELAPRNLETEGLFEAMRENAISYNALPSILVQCIGDEQLLRRDMKINIFRIYQELVTNARKHAKGASTIEVNLAIDGDEVRLLVEDDGKPKPRTPDAHGMGLQNVRSRVDYYGGMLTIDFSENGSSVAVVLPLTDIKALKI